MTCLPRPSGGGAPPTLPPRKATVVSISRRTPAQQARIARARRDLRGTGSRITTRDIGQGRVAVTETGHGERATAILDRDGHYLP